MYFDDLDLIERMLELNALILTTLTLFLVSLFILFYLYVTKSKELDRLKQIVQATIKRITPSYHVCPHHLGYLRSYPSNKPIPDECLDCSDVFDCADKKRKSKPLKKRSKDRKLTKQRTIKVRKQETTKKASRKTKKTTSSTKAKARTRRTTWKRNLQEIDSSVWMKILFAGTLLQWPQMKHLDLRLLLSSLVSLALFFLFGFCQIF